jgi:hypothetical protein
VAGKSEGKDSSVQFWKEFSAMKQGCRVFGKFKEIGRCPDRQFEEFELKKF